jgi:sugar-specific transcriptional regulator TrmB
MTQYSTMKKEGFPLPDTRFREVAFSPAALDYQNVIFSDIYPALSNFGLLKNEAKVYLYLASVGEQKVQHISRTLAIHRTETYKVLKKLEEKGLVYHTFTRPLRFGAFNLEKGLDHLIITKRKKLSDLEDAKEDLLHKWKSINEPIQYTAPTDEFLQILKGKHHIHVKIEEMIHNVEHVLLLALFEKQLTQLFYSGILDEVQAKAQIVQVQVVTDASPTNQVLHELRLQHNQIRYMSVPEIPSFIISDQRLLMFLNTQSSQAKTHAMWTNQEDLVNIAKNALTHTYTPY